MIALYRWILCANHMEPVKGFLSRYLRRKIIDHEMNAGVCDSALTKIVEWIPRAWQQINTFLEKHSSSDVTVGPRLFLDCPMNVRESQLWFTSLWNYSLVPYILEAVKEGLQVRREQFPGSASIESRQKIKKKFLIFRSCMDAAHHGKIRRNGSYRRILGRRSGMRKTLKCMR
jgi:hypothetical protein